MPNINKAITKLTDYAITKGIAEEADRAYITNRILELLRLPEFERTEYTEELVLEEILCEFCDYAAENGLIESNSVVYRDLFDTSVMGCTMPRPGEIISKFFELCKQSPEAATDYFYALAENSDYIRKYRIKKDLKWQVESDYGQIDITVNLSKPEKDPKAIAQAKLQKQTGYPKCLLCHENEGFAGGLTRPARQTLRQIPLNIAGGTWYLQYSPYVYYNEHCILLSDKHEPMKISHATFERMLDFVEFLPHYMIGSNADLPIVGGSILTHDHMQGGRYCFAMENASVEKEFSFKGYPEITAQILHWPLSVIRLNGKSKNDVISLADKILEAWRGYTDADSFIFAETDGEPHNTVTPIARMKNGLFQLDLVLRNNITTEEHPLGVYHPHARLHNIKKENIGLIEVMGLAVLPSRLKAEIEEMTSIILSGGNLSEHENVAKHAAWFNEFADKYTFTKENTKDILMKEIGKTFVNVLEDAGVYKCTEEGRSAFEKFIDYVNK